MLILDSREVSQSGSASIPFDEQIHFKYLQDIWSPHGDLGENFDQVFATFGCDTVIAKQTNNKSNYGYQVS